MYHKLYGRFECELIFSNQTKCYQWINALDIATAFPIARFASMEFSFAPLVSDVDRNQNNPEKSRILFAR